MVTHPQPPHEVVSNHPQPPLEAVSNHPQPPIEVVTHPKPPLEVVSNPHPHPLTTVLTPALSGPQCRRRGHPTGVPMGKKVPSSWNKTRKTRIPLASAALLDLDTRGRLNLKLPGCLPLRDTLSRHALDILDYVGRVADAETGTTQPCQGPRARCQDKTPLSQFLFMLFHIFPCLDLSFRLLFITTTISCLLYALFRGGYKHH